MKKKSSQTIKNVTNVFQWIKSLSRPILIALICLILGIILILIYFLLLPKIIKSQVLDQMQLREGTVIYDKWKEVPVDVYFNVYLFEVVNPIETVQGARARVKERGPYVFIQRQKKEVIGVSNEGETITYNEYSSYIFERKLSNGSLSDLITIPNIPLITFVSTINDKLSKIPGHQLTSPVIFTFLSALLNLNKEHIFTKQTVRSILFDGYTVPFMHTLKMIFFPIHLLFGFQFPKTGLSADNRFALLLGKNNTPTGPFEVYTGYQGSHGQFNGNSESMFRKTGHWSAGQESSFSRIKSFQGSQMLNYWYPKSSHCNLIKGTDGHQFGPFVDKSKSLHIFNPDVCRSFPMTYLSDSSIKGFDTYQYIMSKDTFSSERTFPDNYCYCKRGDFCPDGVLDVSSCRFHAPIWLSNPHLYQAGDRVKKSSVDGLFPVKEKHMSYLHVEPMTGTVLKASIKIGVNVLVKKYRIFKDMKNLQKESLIPVMWINTAAEIDDANAQELRNQLTKPIAIANSSLISFIVASFLLAIFALVRYCFNRKRKIESKEASTVTTPVSQVSKSISPKSLNSESLNSESLNSESLNPRWEMRSNSIPTAPPLTVGCQNRRLSENINFSRSQGIAENRGLSENINFSRSQGIAENRGLSGRNSRLLGRRDIQIYPMINELEGKIDSKWNSKERRAYSPIFVAAIFGSRRPSYPRDLVQEALRQNSSGSTYPGSNFQNSLATFKYQKRRESILTPSELSSSSSSSSPYLNHHHQEMPSRSTRLSSFSQYPKDEREREGERRGREEEPSSGRFSRFSLFSRSSSFSFASSRPSLSRMTTLRASFSHHPKETRDEIEEGRKRKEIEGERNARNNHSFSEYSPSNSSSKDHSLKGFEEHHSSSCVKDDDENIGRKSSIFGFFGSRKDSATESGSNFGRKVSATESGSNFGRKDSVTYDYITPVAPHRPAPPPPTTILRTFDTVGKSDLCKENGQVSTGYESLESRMSCGFESVIPSAMSGNLRLEDFDEAEISNSVKKNREKSVVKSCENERMMTRLNSREMNRNEIEPDDEIFTISRHLFGHRSKDGTDDGQYGASSHLSNGDQSMAVRNFMSKREMFEGHPLKNRFKKSIPNYGLKK